jgi:predicted DNA binding protein/GAF domain-containing protein
MNEALANAPIGVITATVDGVVTAINDRAATLIETPPPEAVGEPLVDVCPASAAGTLRSAIDGEPTPTTVEEYYPRLDRWLAVEVQVADEIRLFCRETTETHELTQHVEELERRLDRIQRIDSLIVRVLQQVIDAADRTAIADTICEQLGTTSRYDFVWVGDREFPNDRLGVIATAGTAPEIHDRIEAALGETDTLPGQRAVDQETTQVVDGFADNRSLPRRLRQAAFASGLQSCLAVPLRYQGAVYGVVSVYSGHTGGFSEQEQAGLETLGRVAGFAIRATRQEDLLVADTVTEVRLSVTGASIPLDRAAAEIETSFSLDGAVPRGDGPVVCYVAPETPVVDADTEGDGDAPATDSDETPTAGDADQLSPQLIEQTLRDDEQVVGVSWVHTGDNPLLQVTVAGETPVTALAGWGASIRSATYRGGTTEIVAEAPPDESVRRLIETVDDTVADTELLAKEETTRSPDTVDAFRNDLTARLTDRQQAALRAAYLAEYFASPRGSTAAEVANALDITGPTLLYHLRRAEQKLVGAFLETEPTHGGGDQ